MNRFNSWLNFLCLFVTNAYLIQPVNFQIYLKTAKTKVIKKS